MISKLCSLDGQSQKKNPSFGKMSVDLKRFVRTPEIKKGLRKVGIDKDVLEVLDKSPIKISLLKDLFEPLADADLRKGAAVIPENAGLIVAPPRGSHLPNLCVTADDEKFLDANSDSFTFSFKKVVDLVNSYQTGKANLHKQNRPLKVRKIKDLHGLDNAIDSRLKEMVDGYNYGGGESAIRNFITDINYINKVAYLKTHEYDIECAKNKKEAMAVVRDEWLNINARRLNTSA